MKKIICYSVIVLLGNACATQPNNEPIVQKQIPPEVTDTINAEKIAQEEQDFLSRKKAAKLGLLCSNPMKETNGGSEIDYSLAPSGIVRFPPITPPLAENSGLVSLIFDLNNEGGTQNVRVMDASDELFKDRAIKSVEKWKYEAASNSKPEIYRKNICTSLNFRVTDIHGNVLPYRRTIATF